MGKLHIICQLRQKIGLKTTFMSFWLQFKSKPPNLNIKRQGSKLRILQKKTHTHTHTHTHTRNILLKTPLQSLSNKAEFDICFSNNLTTSCSNFLLVLYGAFSKLHFPFEFQVFTHYYTFSSEIYHYFQSNPQSHI